MKDGAVQNVVSGASSTGLLPEIHSMSPVCVSNDYMGAVSISGANIAGEGQTVLCRSQGMQSSPAICRPHCFMSAPSSGSSSSLNVLASSYIASFAFNGTVWLTSSLPKLGSCLRISYTLTKSQLGKFTECRVICASGGVTCCWDQFQCFEATASHAVAGWFEQRLCASGSCAWRVHQPIKGTRMPLLCRVTPWSLLLDQ